MNDLKQITILVGKNVKGRRIKMGLTQPQLAEKAGLKKMTIIHIEKGKRSFRLDTILGIADAFGVEFTELFKEVQ